MTETSQTPAPGSGPPYYDWRLLFPELQEFLFATEQIAEEATSISKWMPWPEENLGQNWTVFPFVHTFPALDESKRTFVGPTCEHCPRTVELLRTIPHLRTALFSRLAPGVVLAPHTGWEDLANHVLRCHVPLVVPPGEMCGMTVAGETVKHRIGEIICFDDSKTHQAFNNWVPSGDASADKAFERIVLIIDILRPSHDSQGTAIALGAAEGGHTDQLDAFISQFA